jgi:hypothetical protein
MAEHKPMPASFPERAPGMSVIEARIHYSAGKGSIERWANEVSPILYRTMVDNGKANSLQATKGQTTTRRIVRACEGIAIEPLDTAAMRHIQRTKRWVCYSSRIHEQKGEVLYYVGNRVLNRDELLEVARGFGFLAPVAVPSTTVP